MNPEKFAPSLKDRQLAYDRLFGGGPSAQEEDVINRMLAKKDAPTGVSTNI